MKCPYCRKTIPDATVYCPECGQRTDVFEQKNDVCSAFWENVALNEAKTNLEEETKKKNYNLLAVASMVVIVLIVVFVFLLLKNKNSNAENEQAETVESESTVVDSTQSEAAGAPAELLLETCRIIDSGAYQGNEGDSFVYTIGEHQYSRGNTDINGKSYDHGLEAWIARWNGTDESSWAYATYDVGGHYTGLSGTVVLIDSYNTSNFDSTLYFCDASTDKVLMSYELRPDTIPFDFEVNIYGVSQLKVCVNDNRAVSGGTSFGLVNTILNMEQYSRNKIDNVETVQQKTINTESPFGQDYWVLCTEKYREG